jgi:hypothetical protein
MAATISASVVSLSRYPAAPARIARKYPHLFRSDPRVHFGLGSATSVDLEVRWPLGLVERLTNIAADQLVFLVEGSGVHKTQKFG